MERRKGLPTIVAISFMIVLFGMGLSAGEKVKSNPGVDWNKAEKNYISALRSENFGVRQSAAAFLAEYRLHGAIEPLINVLKNDKVEDVRIAAALSLMTIGDKRGIEAVEEASLYDGSDKVSEFCESLLASMSTTCSLTE